MTIRRPDHRVLLPVAKSLPPGPFHRLGGQATDDSTYPRGNNERCGKCHWPRLHTAFKPLPQEPVLDPLVDRKTTADTMPTMMVESRHRRGSVHNDPGYAFSSSRKRSLLLKAADRRHRAARTGHPTRFSFPDPLSVGPKVLSPPPSLPRQWESKRLGMRLPYPAGQTPIRRTRESSSSPSNTNFPYVRFPLH